MSYHGLIPADDARLRDAMANVNKAMADCHCSTIRSDGTSSGCANAKCNGLNWKDAVQKEYENMGKQDSRADAHTRVNHFDSNDEEPEPDALSAEFEHRNKVFNSWRLSRQERRQGVKPPAVPPAWPSLDQLSPQRRGGR